MQDFNFFESYLSSGRQTNTASFRYGRTSALLLVLLAAWPLYNLGYGYLLKQDVAALETEVTGDEAYPLLEQANTLQNYLSQLQDQLAALKQTDAVLKDSEWLNEPFLFSLLSTVSKDMQIQQMSVLPEKGIQLSGSASNKPAIAELERNLRETGRFAALHVESIKNDDGTYGFQINFTLKDVGTDAAN